MKKLNLLVLLVALLMIVFFTASCDTTKPQSTTASTTTHQHIYQWSKTIEPCTKPGLMVGVCDCGDKQTRTLSAIGYHIPAEEWTVGVAPTCTESGTKVKVCTACNVVLDTRLAPFTGHQAGEWVVEIAPTCTETGSKNMFCAKCNELVKTAMVNKTEHSYGEWTTTLDPTCTEAGQEERVCKECDIVQTRTTKAIGHNCPGTWKIDIEPTCTEKGSKYVPCIRCGSKERITEIPANGHSFGDWTQTLAPTCTEKGSDRRDCDVCDHFETKEIAATGHSFGVWTRAVDPTCTEKGSDRRDCDVCDHFETKEIAATGHSLGEWITDAEATCTENGSKHQICLVCNETVNTENLPAFGHTYNPIVLPKRCIEKAKIVYTCGDCDDSYTVEISNISVSMLWTSTGSSTINGYGTYTRHYSISSVGGYGAIEYKYELYSSSTSSTPISTIDFTTNTDYSVSVKGYYFDAGSSVVKITARDSCGNTSVYRFSLADESVVDYEVPFTHIEGEWIIDDEATCTEAGSKRKVCSVCSAIVINATIEPTGHSYDSVVVEPTKTTDGYTTHTCSVCREVYSDTFVPAIGSLGLAYEVNADGTTCTVTGIGTCTDTDVYIPQKIDGYTVTAIAEKAFAENATVTMIRLPNTVTTIGRRAFYKCTEITEFTIPESVTSIGLQIFYGCDKLTTVYYNGQYGNKDNPFLNVKSIETVIFGSTTIPDYVAYNTTTLKTIVIMDSVTTIGMYAFGNCVSLTAIEVPDNVVYICHSAFSGCSGLESITLPFVGTYAKTEHDLYQYPFGEIFGEGNYTGGVATEQTYHANSTYYSTTSTYYIPSSLKSVTITGGNILCGAFQNCSTLETIILPDSVQSIGDYAFSGCSSLTSIIIPDSVTSIGTQAFSKCSSLTSITIPDGVTKIGSSAFSGCTGLLSIIIPDSVTSIGDSAFSSCSSMTSITIPDSVLSIGGSAFYSCTGLLSIKIPDSITSIEYNVFQKCTGLTNIVLPDSVMSIGEYAFSGCTSLTSITIPDSVTSIGKRAFSRCSSLTSITIPDGLMIIGEEAFYNCNNLVSVAIPDSVISIGESAFDGCDCLTILCEAESRPSGWSSSWNPLNRPVAWSYSGEEHTYIFDTNGGTSIDSIVTSIAIMLPTPKKEGMYFVGWYDNVACEGDALTSSYYSATNHTLYAKWMTEEEWIAWHDGSSFEKAIPMEIGNYYGVLISLRGEMLYYSFTAPESRSYTFSSSGSHDTYAYLYDSNQRELVATGSGMGDLYGNFSFTRSLQAGETYYLATKLSSNSQTGSFIVRVV